MKMKKFNCLMKKQQYNKNNNNHSLKFLQILTLINN